MPPMVCAAPKMLGMPQYSSRYATVKMKVRQMAVKLQWRSQRQGEKWHRLDVEKEQQACCVLVVIAVPHLVPSVTGRTERAISFPLPNGNPTRGRGGLLTLSMSTLRTRLPRER